MDPRTAHAAVQPTHGIFRRVMLSLCLLGSALVAACGGGDAASDAAAAASDATVREQAQAAGEQRWVECAREGGQCSFTGTRQVRYGTATALVVRELSGGTACTNAVFGDPAYGQAKYCWVAEGDAAAQGDAAAAAGTDWVECAKEGGHCAFTGTQSVRYGTPQVNVVRSLSGGTACTNTVFGDPAVAQTKWCWVATARSTPAAAAPPAADAGGWVRCASESQTCSFTGTRIVRYGTDTVFVSRTLTGGTACSNDVFGDPAVAQTKYCRHAASSDSDTAQALPAVVETPAGATGSNPPVVFNVSRSARPGDVISLQGANFGSAPRVTLDGTGQALTIVNRVGEQWLAVELPSTARGALALRVANQTGVSRALRLNQAQPTHLDTFALVPGGVFRVFGRHLLQTGYTPKVSVDGRPATIDLAQSNEHMLVARAPADLAPRASVAVRVDNGNGHGAFELDRDIAAIAGSGDAFGLGVGWGAVYTELSRRVVAAASDSRLASKLVCNGSQDGTRALQAAIDLAASTGGGIVRLPAGTCRLAGAVGLRSGVVLEGAGKTATTLRYEGNFPLIGQRLERVGIRQLALVNAGPASEGLQLKDSRYVFLQQLRIDSGTSRQLFLSGNRQMVVSGTDFVQRGSIADHGAYNLGGSSALVFTGNTTSFVNGTATFGRVHDAYIAGNRFVRDGSFQQAPGIVHTMAIDFTHRIAIVDNVFEVANGPIRNKTRNDGETLLTEGGGGVRTETLGQVGSAGATTLTDSSHLIDADAFDEGSVPENYGVAIVAGKGAGQTRRVTGQSGSTLTVSPAWEVVPDGSSRYASFVWGLEKALIKGNRFAQNPRGIWLYHTAVRDVDVIGNDIREGGGIYLRSFQDLSKKHFMPIYNVRIAGNQVRNTTREWSSYINAVFVNADARAFGIANIGIEVRDNLIAANAPNLSSNWEEYAGVEGFMGMMRVENYDRYEPLATPQQIGTIFQGNRCDGCDVAFRLGTGAGGTVLWGNPQGSAGTLYTDWATTRTTEKASSMLVR